MGLGKTYSADYLIDSNGNTGGSGQVLISTATGIDWADGAAITGGPFLPLAGGTITGNVRFNDTFKAEFGSSADLQINHDGTDSLINNGTGHLTIRNSASDKNIFLQADNGSGGNTSYLTLNGASTHAYFSNPGNVGIGTTAPYSNLWVSGLGINAASELTTTDTTSNAILALAGTNSLVRLQMGTMDVSPWGGWIQASYDNTSEGSTNGVAPLLLNPLGGAAGNVGIGTTAPGTINGVAFSSVGLHVKAGTLGRTITEGTSFAEFIMNHSSASANQKVKYLMSKAGVLELGSMDDNGTRRGQVSILNNNNVGIGTASPSSANGFDAKLQLESANPMLVYKETDQTTKWEVGAWGGNYVVYNGTNERMRIDSAGSATFAGSIDTTAVNIKVGTAIHGTITSSSNSLTLNARNTGKLIFQSGGVEKMRINGTNVGIGTTDPTEKLAVNGNIETTGASGKIGFNVGDAYGDFPHYGLGKSDGANPVNLAGYYGLTFGSDGAERMRIDSAGNVGIGTTAPGAKLQIGSATYAPNANLGNNLLQIKSPSGFAYLTIGNGDSANSTSYIGGASGFTVIGSVTDAGALSEHMRITNTGNVGIGTTSPGSLLQVGGLDDGSNYDITLGWNAVDSEAVGTKRSAITFKTGQTSVNTEDIYKWDIAMLAAPATVTNEEFGSDLAFLRSTRGSTATDATTMILTRTGNVGIGTGVPAGSLDVYGTTGSKIRIALFTDQNTDDPTLKMFYGKNTRPGYSFTSDNTTGLFSSASGGFLGFTVSQSERMRITSAGNVGIGTTSPGAKLHVSAASGIAFKVNPNNVDKEWYIDTTNPDHLKKEGNLNISADPTAAHASTKINFLIDGSNKMRIQDNGNVGISTTSPSYALDVTGTIRATGDVIAYSDARVKENVETVPNALDKVKSMRGVVYNKIDEEKRSVGVIAQELLEVVPEAVHQDDSGMYSVAYGNLVGVLVEAMKEQQQQIDELKAKLDGITK